MKIEALIRNFMSTIERYKKSMFCGLVTMVTLIFSRQVTAQNFVATVKSGVTNFVKDNVIADIKSYLKSLESKYDCTECKLADAQYDVFVAIEEWFVEHDAESLSMTEDAYNRCKFDVVECVDVTSRLSSMDKLTMLYKEWGSYPLVKQFIKENVEPAMSTSLEECVLIAGRSSATTIEVLDQWHELNRNSPEQLDEMFAYVGCLLDVHKGVLERIASARTTERSLKRRCTYDYLMRKEYRFVEALSSYRDSIATDCVDGKGVEVKQKTDWKKKHRRLSLDAIFEGFGFKFGVRVGYQRDKQK